MISVLIGLSYLCCGFYIYYKIKNKNYPKEYPVDNRVEFANDAMKRQSNYYSNGNPHMNNQSFSMSKNIPILHINEDNRYLNSNDGLNEDIQLTLDYSGRQHPARFLTYHTPVKKIRNYNTYHSSIGRYNHRKPNCYKRERNDFSIAPSQSELEDEYKYKYFRNNKHPFRKHSRRSRSQEAFEMNNSVRSNFNDDYYETTPRHIFMSDIPVRMNQGKSGFKVYPTIRKFEY